MSDEERDAVGRNSLKIVALKIVYRSDLPYATDVCGAAPSAIPTRTRMKMNVAKLGESAVAIPVRPPKRLATKSVYSSL